MIDYKLELLNDMLKHRELYYEVYNLNLIIQQTMLLKSTDGYYCLHICANKKTKNEVIKGFIIKKEKNECEDIYKKGLSTVVLYSETLKRKEIHTFKTYNELRKGLDGYRFNDFVIHKNMRFPYEKLMEKI